MTERTIRSIAKEFAGEFYDFTRSKEDGDHKVQFMQRGRLLLQIDPKAFAKSFPTVKDYIAGRQHGYTKKDPGTGAVTHIDDGKIYQITPGWAHWYDLARKRAVEMLASPLVHENLKRGIYDALLEDREKQERQKLRHQPFTPIHQRHHIGPRE
jgi:hypothetical protein